MRWLVTFGFTERPARTAAGPVSSREIALRVKREEERRLLR
jgi:hypothetical protein